MAYTSKTTFKEKDLGMKRILGAINSLDDAVVLVGLPGRNSPNYEDLDKTVAEIAVINEFGSPANNIPKRPFMVQTYERHGQKALKYLERMARQVVHGKVQAKQALNRVGVFYTGRVKDTIRNGAFVPNAPATIAAKKSSKPLIDTGTMRNSVTHVLAAPNAKGTV